MRFRGPLADSYGSAVLLVLLALTPYLALTGAVTPLNMVLSKSVGMSMQSLQLTSGMANAGYAFGTVMAVQFAVHLRGRRMLVLYATLFTIASVLAAWAPTPAVFIAGRIVQGLCTSLMLIAAAPPLVVGWGVERMPISGIIMNLGIFGAVAVGPVVGGVQAGAGAWRPLFWVVAGLGAGAILFALLTFEDAEPLDHSAPWDWVAMVLAGGGSAAAFFGASELQTHPMTSLIVIAPLLAGAGMIVVLVLDQYLINNPLMPVRQMWTTIPISGVIVAMTAGAASVALIELAQTALAPQGNPIHTAMLFWPEFGGALATAALFGALFRTRFTPLLAFVGMIVLAGGAAVLTGVAGGPHALVVVGSGLVGLGVGASVAPALFAAGFAVRANEFQRVVALIELLRGVAAFMVAPVLLHLAMTVTTTPRAGIATAIWVCFGLAAGGGLLAAYLFALGRVRLRAPALDDWQSGKRPAVDSPPLAAGIRGELTAPVISHSARSPASTTPSRRETAYAASPGDGRSDS